MKHQEVYRKFIEIKEVEGYDLNTPNGWKKIKRVMKTIPYQKWYLELEDGFHLEAADNHIVYRENQEIFMKDIQVGDLIDTEDGLKQCIRCYTENEFDNMYDVEVEGSIFYSNGILSHNTTAVSMYLIWYSMFSSHKTVAILANKDDTAKSILEDIKTAYENLPNWIKLGVTEYNAHTIAFENGSKIFCRGTSKDACAGESVSFLYLDEFSLLPPNLAEEFYRANYPTISKGEKIVITSTARGVGNLFHKIWKGAIDKTNTYFPYRVDYWQVPEYRVDNWKEDMISDIGLIAFNSEYGNQFIGSQTTAISPTALQNLKSSSPIREEKIHDGTYKVYEEYDPKSTYIASVDVSTGSGNDHSILQIYRVDWRKPIEEDYIEYANKLDTMPEAIIKEIIQCAIFRSNLINIPSFVDYTFEILPQWGEPYFILENNGIGQSFADKMQTEYYWENSYYHPDSATVGVNSNGATKIQMVNSLKYYTEKNKLIIRDVDTVNEFLTFIEKKSSSGNSKFQAEEGSYDDCVVSTGWGCFLCDTIYMQDALTFTI